MRFSGRLHDWNEQRGFGFIRPLAGGDDVFVHASALPSPRPSGQEVLSFEVALDARGRKKAVQVRRQAAEAVALQADRAREAHSAPTRGARGRHRSGSGLGGIVAGLVVTAALGWFGYGAYQQAAAKHAAEEGGTPFNTRAPLASSPSSTAVFTCDGRTHCSQMRSCEEATFFVRNCPRTEMDGDGDGVPCEQQWCTGSWR